VSRNRKCRRENDDVVHEVAASGFSDAADYEAARPSYPDDAVAWFVDHLEIHPGRRVVDLAAGTGKLTRLLVPAGAELVAVEPVAGMRDVLHATMPRVPVLAATAEALPFAPSSLDAVVVAQAWHWFDHDVAVAQLREVLRVGGRLGLVWNARDRSEPWVDEVWSVMDRVEKRAPWRDHENWRDSAFRKMRGFGRLERAEFFHRQSITPDGILRRIASVSHVAVLEPQQRDAVFDEVRTIISTHPGARGRPVLEIPYRVDCLCVERLP
jgi:SAM-dependent methyltransferase